MPAELDNMDPEMDQEMSAEPEMGAEDQVGSELGHGDQEGAMAKQELIKLANYATNLQEHIEDDEQLEAWVQSKITIAATNIASVYHYIAYEKKIGEYGEALDSAPMSENKRRALKGWLMEAKAKVKELKKAQAQKMSEEFTDKSKVGDTFKTKTGVATKTDTGVKHTNTSYHDDGEAEEKSGKGIKSHAKAKSSEEKKADRSNDIKLPKHSGNTWGMKNGEKFGKKMEEAKKADKDYDQDGKIESGKDEYLGSKIRAAKKAGKLKEGTCSVCRKDPCCCKKEKKCNECGMYESKCECDHSVKEAFNLNQLRAAVGSGAGNEIKNIGTSYMNTAGKQAKGAVKSGATSKTGKPMDLNKLKPGQDLNQLKPGQVLGKIQPTMEATKGKCCCEEKGKMKCPVHKPMSEDRTMSRAAKGVMKYGKDGMKALAKAGKEGKSLEPVKAKYNKYDEGAKPSAGLTKGEKSAVVKKAKAGGDIGKPGKSFDKVAKAAGGGKKGEKIAAAAMWKNIKETTSYIAEKKKKEKMSDEGNEFSGALKKAREHGDTKMTVDGKSIPVKPGKTIPESSDLARMRQLTDRLNVNEKTHLNENDEVNNLRRLSNLLKG